MFRKAQFRFFGIIISILLAIFIAVLGSINVLTREVTNRQTLVVLENIAAGVEYDERTSKFTFTPPDDEDFRKKFGYNDKPREQPPSKPSSQPSSSYKKPEEKTTEATSEETTAEEPTTETHTQKETETEATEEVTSAPETEPETQPQEEHQTVPSVQASAETKYDDHDNDAEDDDDDKDDHDDDHDSDDDDDRKRRKQNEPRQEQKNPDQWWGNPEWWGNPDWWKNPWWGDPEQNKEPVPTEPNWQQSGQGRQQPFSQEWQNQGENQSAWNWNFYDQNANGTAYTDSEEIILTQLTDTATTSEAPPEFPTGNDFPEGQPPDFNGDSPMFDDRGAVPNRLGSIDFFIVMADNQGKYLATLNNDDLSEETAQQYITDVLAIGDNTGMVNKTYQFYQTSKHNGTLIVLTDKSAEIQMQKNLTRTTIIIGIITFIVLSFFAFFLSRKIMQPLKSAFDKQKQFISDASHELKTPLTVISTNADVLSDEIGENKWLNYIKSQAERMSVLVNELLNLTRLENNSSNFIKTDFNLSQAITNTALPFECQAFESGKKFIVDVEDGLTVNGSEQHIRQMTAIFIDNALKYSKENGTVRVTLRKQNDKKVLSVYNTGKGVRDEEVDKIFERFYRSDESRNRSTGGYGLGLAIAKSIIDKHKFKVHVDNAEGKSICFVVTM